MTAFFGVWLIALLVPAGLRAQAGATGAITGTVVDQNGGAVSGATIIVTNVATGQKEREVSSTDAGTFNIPSLTPGNFTVEITASGFSKSVMTNVVVQVTETSSIAATLTVGNVTETVIVKEVSIPVNVTSAVTGDTISADTASTLPLSTRNFLTLLTLSTGANTELFDSAALGRDRSRLMSTGNGPLTTTSSSKVSMQTPSDD